MRQYKLRPLLTLIQALLHYQVWEVQRVMWQAEQLLELMSVLLQRRGCQQPVSSTIFRSVILKGRVQALLNWQRRRPEIEAAAVSLNVGANDGNRCGARTMFDRVAFFFQGPTCCLGFCGCLLFTRIY